MRASIKEDSQKATTLTDNKKRDYENEGSSMHEDSCIGINYAHTHMFPKCFRSLHTLLGFALCFVSSILIFVAVIIYSILTCTRIPCRDLHCENGSFEVLSLQNQYSRVLLPPPSVTRSTTRKRWKRSCPDLSLLLKNQLTEIDGQLVLLRNDNKGFSAARLISERQNVMDVLKGCGLDSKSSTTSNFLILPCRLLVAMA